MPNSASFPSLRNVRTNSTFPIVILGKSISEHYCHDLTLLKYPFDFLEN